MTTAKSLTILEKKEAQELKKQEILDEVLNVIQEHAVLLQHLQQRLMKKENLSQSHSGQAKTQIFNLSSKFDKFNDVLVNIEAKLNKVLSKKKSAPLWRRRKQNIVQADAFAAALISSTRSEAFLYPQKNVINRK